MRLVSPFYTLSFVLVALIIGYNNTTERDPLNMLLVFPAVLALWTAWRHLKLRFTRMIIERNKLRYETGMLSKSTRTMDLSRIQDVRVEQSILQRLAGIGSVSIETAGESGQLVMKNVDQPHNVAEYILESSRK